MMDLGLSGRRAVITGGSKGIGLAVAGELVAEGTSVAICARHPDELAAAAATLTASGSPGVQVFSQVTDVTEPDQVNAFVERVVRERPAEWFWTHKRWPAEAYAAVEDR